MNAILWSQLLDAEGLLSSLPTGIIATTNESNATTTKATTTANSVTPGSAMLGMWGNTSNASAGTGVVEEVVGSAPTSTVTTDASCGKAFM